MQVVRQIVDAEKLSQVVNIPEEMRYSQLEVIVLPIVVKDKLTETLADTDFSELKEKSLPWLTDNEISNIKNAKQRIYIDTSIVGGFFDKEFADPTIALFDKLKRKEIIFVVSDLLRKELIDAPDNVRSLLENYEPECFEPVSLTEKAKELANDYIAEKVIGKTSLEDCQHIAMATLSKVDILASWNFKHIVNINRIRGYNSVNLKRGYATLEIRNPRELIEYDEN